MAERKRFSQLSQRQKRRRINIKCKETFNEIDLLYAHLQNSYYEEGNEERVDANEILENSGIEFESLGLEWANDNTELDYIAAEFNKVVDTSVTESFYDSSTDFHSSDEEEYISEKVKKDKDIKIRLSNLLVISNFPDIHANSLLKILRDAGLNYLPRDVRSLRNTPRKTITTTCNPGHYFHYGLRLALENAINKSNDEIGYKIEIDVNVDGLPITKSPQSCLWPILGKIANHSSNEVFLIGAYHGAQKPNSPEIFLDPFINEYLHLHGNGFIYKGRKYFVNIRCLICDSPAASYVLCTKQFNGYYGCRKCIVKGKWISRLVFLYEDSPLRTNASFRTRVQAEHHNGISPFERLTFDMVQQVPLDYMHLICLGITKHLLRLWINPRTMPKLNILQLDSLSNFFVALSPYIPKDFARKPQTLLELGRWKATTFRLFLLYTGPIILQSILPKEYMEHFNVLSCAVRILCHPTRYHEFNEYAKELLVYFVRKFKILYGKEWVTWNTHNLIHIADDSKLFGPLDKYSAFPFENYMQSLKRCLRKKEQPLQQIHRRLTEKSTCNKIQYRTKENLFSLMSQPASNRALPRGCYNSHHSLQFFYFELKDSRPNNCCVTVENKIIVIEHICKYNNEDVIVGREFLSKEDIPNYPIKSNKMGICQVKNLSEIQIIAVASIRSKMCLFFHHGKSYVTPLLHHN